MLWWTPTYHPPQLGWVSEQVSSFVASCSTQSALAGNFLHNVIVVVTVLASKAQCIVIDVEVAVHVRDSWQDTLLLWPNKFFF